MGLPSNHPKSDDFSMFFVLKPIVAGIHYLVRKPHIGIFYKLWGRVKGPEHNAIGDLMLV